MLLWTNDWRVYIAEADGEGMPMGIFGVKGGRYQSWDFCLCVCNQGAYADNLADAVDRLLMNGELGDFCF